MPAAFTLAFNRDHINPGDRICVAISGGADSVALLLTLHAANTAKRDSLGIGLSAAHVHHGIRPAAESDADLAFVQDLCIQLDIPLHIHHADIPTRASQTRETLEEAARTVRYEFFSTLIASGHADSVLTAHTLDDQAETVLLRLMRGSGVAGIGGMARRVRLCDLLAADPRIAPSRGSNGPSGDITAVSLVRPFLGVAKSRLVATLREAGLVYAEDPSNRDPRFARARLRRLMPALAGEGLTPDRLDRLAHRVRRGELALEAMTDAAAERLGYGADFSRIALAASDWGELPGEIALRLLGRAIGRVGDEGPVELGKLETLHDALTAAFAGGAVQFRRTLAGAMVSLQKGAIVIERAPPRQRRSAGRAASASRH